jgi:Anti-sigma-K factor rskA
MTHEEHKGLLALAALDDLDDLAERERDAFDEHLAGCGECWAELRELRDAAALLALVPPPRAPRPELRSRILAEIKSVRQEPSGGAGRPQQEPARDAARRPAADEGRRQAAGDEGRRQGERPGGVAAPVSAGGAGASKVVSLDAARREARGVERPASFVSRPALLFGALAASVVLFALAAMLVILWQRNNDLRGELARLSAALTETRAQLDVTRTELAEARSESSLLASPDVRTAQLAGTELAASARARLAFDERTGAAVLTAANLPPAPAGKAYQLWYIAEGRPPTPGPVFASDAEGRAELRETIPPAGRRAAVFAVTLEPASGSPAPTGEIYLKGPAS